MADRENAKTVGQCLMVRGKVVLGPEKQFAFVLVVIDDDVAMS
jgi:hypothetical protein